MYGNELEQLNGLKGDGESLEESLTVTRKSSLDSDGGHPSSERLLAKMANDYSQYLKTDLSFQISKVEEFVEESIAKLEEYRGLLEMKKSERASWVTHILPDLIRTGTLLSITLNQRLDSLSSLILSIQAALETLEGEISQAEAKLGIPSQSSTSTTIRSVFKYFIKAEEPEVEQVLAKSKKPKPPSFQQLLGPDPLQIAQFFHTS